MRLRDLPTLAREVGISTFGSAAALEGVLNQTRIRLLSTLNGTLTLKMASMQGDRSISHLQREMRHDRYDVKGLQQHSGVVLDVGANLGYYSLVVAKLYPQMRVLAVEPTPPTFFFLVVNLHLNRVRLMTRSTFRAAKARGVLPLHAAMGSKATANGTSITMHYPIGGGDSQLAMATSDSSLAPRGGFRTQRVPLVDMDDFLVTSGVRRVRVLKIDCEGCEWSLVPNLRAWLTPPLWTDGMKMRFWTWPSWWRPMLPRVERIVGELHTGPLEPSYDFEMRRRAGRPVMRPEVDHVFQTVRILAERGCSLGKPGHTYLSPC